jgi:DNA invertase Pin-like site-specific DNA recombinase
MAKKKQGAIYGRKSREKAETLEGQINACIQWCERNDVEYEVFAEEGSASSEDWNREKLQEMITKLKNLEFDLVIVTEQTRICRDDMFPIFKQVLLDNQILFVTADNNSIFDFSNPDDELKSDILQAVGKNELSRTKIRLKRGMVQSAKKGNWVGKKRPIGYEYDKKTKRLAKNVDAPVIRQIFDLYLDGMSTKDIANKFTFENVQTKKEMIWTPSGIARILSNVVYAGHSLYGRTSQKFIKDEHGSKTKKRKTIKTDEANQILEEGTHKGIVTQEEFDEVQRIKANRNSRPPKLKLAKHKYSGLIKCSLCGQVHSFQTARGKLRISSCQTRHYKDASLTSYTVCENKGANIDDFEQLFFIQFKKKIDELENYIDLIKSKEKANTLNPADKINTFENQLKKIDQEIKRVQQGFIMEIFTQEEAQKQIKGYRTQKENIDKEIENLRSQSVDSQMDYLDRVLGKLKGFLSGYDVIPETEANEILREFVDGIMYKKVGGQNADINLRVIWK